MTTTAITARPYAGEADLAPLVVLLNLCSARDALDDTYDVAGLRHEFTDPRLDAARDLQLWEDHDGALTAFGQLWRSEPDEADAAVDGYSYTRIHPDHRQPELEDAVLAWAEARLRESGRGRKLPLMLRSGAAEHHTAQRAMLTRNGMAVARYFFMMERSLDVPIAAPQLPEGFTLRQVVSAEDEAGWVDAYNLSFIDHYNFHPRTIESHRHWLQEAAYDRSRDLIAVAKDGTVAAFAFCWIDQQANERNGRREGSVDDLGVRRGYRKLGLGRAMLLAGLQQLKSDGMATAKLGVDAENPSGALQLYESVGFRRAMTRIQYLKELGAQLEPPTNANNVGMLRSNSDVKR